MKEFWNERFASEEYFYGVHPNKFLASVSGIFPQGAKILCIGEGEGRNAVFLATLGLDVTAVDFSEEGKKKSLALAEKNKVKLDYHISALENFDFGQGQWDVVVSIFCHLPSTIRCHVHRKMQASLKKGGLVILQSYNPKQLEYNTGGPKDLSMLYTPELIREDLNIISWIKLENSLCEISEGKGHQGMSSVLSGVGRLEK